MTTSNTQDVNWSDKTLIDIYGKQVLEKDWQVYGDFIVYCSEEIPPLDLPTEFFREIRKRNNLENLEVLHVLSTAVKSHETDLPLYTPLDWMCYAYKIFLKTGSSASVQQLEIQNHFEYKEIGGKRMAAVEGSSYQIFETIAEYPGRKELLEASEYLTEDLPNHGYLPPMDAREQLLNQSINEN